MQFLKKFIIAVTIIISFITFSQAETSWITKKKDKKDKVEKVEKAEKTNSSWIKKKEIKENKEKVKEKIKESKSWITKKSKEKKEEIKDNLKKHKNFDQLPKAEFYFAGIIEPLDNEDPLYVYGYVNSDKNSDTFLANNQNYFSKSDGVAYFEDRSNRCEVDSQIGVLFGDIKGKVVLKCKKGLRITGDFKQTELEGRGDGETSDGNFIKFKFYNSKIEAIAQLENYKLSETKIVERTLPKREKKKIILKPNGKYYALLIGNSAYDDKGWDDLVSPVNDINEIKKVLDNSYNFEKIIMVKNGTEKQIFQALKNLSSITTTNDYVLIYYSGHGYTNEFEQSYWIPSNGSKEEGLGDWINIIEIDNYIKKIKAHHLALMVDSCFVGGRFKGINLLDRMAEEQEEMFGANLKDDLNLRSRTVLSSGTSGEVTDTAPGSKHSLFALTFIQTLKESEKKSMPVNMNNIGLKMRLFFSGKTFNKPKLYSPPTWNDGGGSFIFIPKKNLR
tara:strand:+ start:597 stop:2105 length:1509 start_codon:yes stop_codon:yes gene_type:complete